MFEVPIDHLMQQTGTSQLQEPNITVLTASEALVTPDGCLNTDYMASKRHAHDSKVHKHHGNERPRIASKDLPVPHYDPDTGHEVLTPSQYSKAVSFYWRSHEDPEHGEARKHRWKTLGKRKLCDTTNDQPNMIVTGSDESGTQVKYVEADQQVGPGTITTKTPLVKDKWVVVIKQDQYFYLGRVLAIFEHNAGKHAWVSEAHSRANISYVSLEIYEYHPGQTNIQAAHQQERPNEWTFSHIPAKFIAYLFTPPCEDSDFIFLGPGHYQVPTCLVDLIATSPVWQRLFLPKSHKKTRQRRVTSAVEKH
ncbi:uncharacterized protein MELLADRAFT_95235 [Melampsora larici-populina 98AG31]|uniref:BAH domain-containing protein n=1 Tax=Melampsora larici-populina (strain 98AG31 / pathotype 3-4-7) TaxID=747676 RepID=F4RCM4_MELLP|nr:uncharacterized protein MELLADRAFT_95235 [Melampsora larici-populina 98AG31]EGG09761.1 hypothetical protein MELLADRAFT_95235 [Melampsora larici-populina 98AG31]